MEVVHHFSDTELIENFSTGKRINESVRFLYRQHFEPLSWFVINNSGNQQDAEDIFQEVVLQFIEMVQLKKFRGESSVKTILFAINRNLWLNELKRKDRSDKRELKYQHTQDKETPDASGTIADRESRNTIMDVMTQLGDTCKKILVMYYYENLSVKEMVEHLDYDNEQVIRNKKYKCLKQLEQMITANPSLYNTLKNLLNG